MKALFTVLMMIFVAGSAIAVIDPDPNSLGVYFDFNADVNYLDVAPDTQFWAYVTLTNPTWDFVQAIEFGYELVVPEGTEASLFRLADTCPPGTVGPWLGWDTGPLVGYCVYGFTPLPTTEATVLMKWLFWVIDPMTIQFFLKPSPIPTLPDGLPVIQNEINELMSLGVSSGDVTLPVAEVNTGHQPVAAESATWGEVKSLYR